MERQPAFAGQFYPLENLKEEIQKLLGSAKTGPRKAITGIAPHAGYVYSGRTAAFTYNALKENKPENIAIICPNHTGVGDAVSVDNSNYWINSIGKVEVNKKIAGKVSEEFSLNSEAHEYEHSIEVQLPFIQTVFKKAKIIPICMMDQTMKTAEKLGNILDKNLGKNDLVIASSDFSHYVSQRKAIEDDYFAIQKISKMNVDEYYKAVENKVSICGYGCIAVAMQFSLKRKAKKAELLNYSTSADYSNDKNNVVGYASIVFE